MAVAAPLEGICPNPVLDDRTIHIQTPEDIERVRTSLIEYIWGQDTLPADFDEVTVTPNVTSPFACQANVNLAQVDQINLAMQTAQGVNTVNGWAWHFTPVKRNNKLAIVHDGHMGCTYFMEDESGLSDGALGMQMAVNALLQNGYDVLFVLMPFYVPDQCLENHSLLFTSAYAPPVGSPFRYFLDTTLQSLNYLESLNEYSEVDMIGLSGGGWTTTLYAAVDPRIMRSFPVAGSIPLYLRGTVSLPPRPDSAFLGVVSVNGNECNDLGDMEQYLPDFYGIAGYPDLYVLGSYGAGREQVQILNRNDSCCFGQTQEAEPDDYDGDLRTYEFGVRDALRSLGTGRFRLEVDEVSTHHQISRNALHGIILAELNQSRAGTGAASSAHAFKRGDNGHLWESEASGWQDLGFRIVGVPAVLENGTYPLQMAVRDAQNEPEFIYNDGTQWHSLPLPSSGLPNLPYGQGKIVADPAIVSTGDGSSDVIGQGTDFMFYHWRITTADTAFEPVGGSTYSVGLPALAMTDEDTFGITYRSGESTDVISGCIEQPDVLYQLMPDSDGTWQPEQRIGGLTQTFPSSGSFAGEQQAYVLGQGGGLSKYSTEADQWQSIVAASPSFVGSPGTPVAAVDGPGLYMRTSDNDLAWIVYNDSWGYTTLGLNPQDSSAPQSVVDSPLDTPDGVYWTGQDGQIRFYDGVNVNTLNAVDTIFREDFEGVLSP